MRRFLLGMLVGVFLISSVVMITDFSVWKRRAKTAEAIVEVLLYVIAAGLPEPPKQDRPIPDNSTSFRI